MLLPFNPPPIHLPDFYWQPTSRTRSSTSWRYSSVRLKGLALRTVANELDLTFPMPFITIVERDFLPTIIYVWPAYPSTLTSSMAAPTSVPHTVYPSSPVSSVNVSPPTLRTLSLSSNVWRAWDPHSMLECSYRRREHGDLSSKCSSCSNHTPKITILTSL